MKAEIIAIGSELTSGVKLDTNSQWLSLQLAEIGVPVGMHTTLADDLADIVAELRAAVERAELVLITGGLGPTLDDLTRQALAELSGTELVLHQQSLDFIRGLFASRNREMPERNVIQAMFPAPAQALPNPRGTAPGVWLEQPRSGGRPPCRVAALPGVPSEMRQMFFEQVLPRLERTHVVIRRARVNCFGVGESQAEEMLGDLTARGRDPDVGITAHEATITLRITAHGRSEAECLAKIDAAKQTIRHRMGVHVFGEEDEELEHAVVALLRERGKTLATAEAGTGGLVAQRLTAAPGFQACYLGGAVVPSAAAKAELLGVDPALLSANGGITAEVARAMARGARERFSADYALGVTECPDFRADDLRDGGRSFVALAGPDVLIAVPLDHFGDPAIARSRTAKTALDLLRRRLID